jgi:hypothetical protein
MICAPCKNRRHNECPTNLVLITEVQSQSQPIIVPAKDKTWCDCGHRTQKEKK